MKRSDAVIFILGERRNQLPGERGAAYAPANIALCKYWGKRDAELNLPVTSSLSISLGALGAHTDICPAENDEFILNEKEMSADHPATVRLFDFIDLFRDPDGPRFKVVSKSTIPVGAGLASSASGFAACVLALDDLYGWGLQPHECSILARLGSGSASRSVYSGFVKWNAGEQPDGMDSYAEPLPGTWSDFCVGMVVLSDTPKKVGSREGMIRTVTTSTLYDAWPAQVEKDMQEIEEGIQKKDVAQVGIAAERNALAMHATMMAATPPLLYWKPATVEVLHRVWALRRDGVNVYLTMDAGPNVKLLFLKDEEDLIRSGFPQIKIVHPF